MAQKEEEPKDLSLGRVNIPLNLEKLSRVPEVAREEVHWFHQTVISKGITWQEACDAIRYDKSVIHKVLHCYYEGSYSNVAQKIRAFRRTLEDRQKIKSHVFIENSISRLIWDALDFGLASQTMVPVLGESRTGKTAAVKAYAKKHETTCTYVVCPPGGSAGNVLREIAKSIGVKKQSTTLHVMTDAIMKAFNGNRMLILDEAHRLLNSKNSHALDWIRHIHDTTECAVAIITTSRFMDDLEKGEYMHEQLLGRLSKLPLTLPSKISRKDIIGIIRHYVDKPSDYIVETLEEIANKRGRLGVMVKALEMASTIAAKARQPITEKHIVTALSLRRQMMNRRKKQ